MVSASQRKRKEAYYEENNVSKSALNQAYNVVDSPNFRAHLAPIEVSAFKLASASLREASKGLARSLRNGSTPHDEGTDSASITNAVVVRDSGGLGQACKPHDRRRRHPECRSAMERRPMSEVASPLAPALDYLTRGRLLQINT